MAGTAVNRKGQSPVGTAARAVIGAHNKVVVDLDALRTTINAIITAAATNIAAVAAVTPAVAITAFLVKDAEGVTILDDAR
jgi:hypothetical protein